VKILVPTTVLNYIWLTSLHIAKKTHNWKKSTILNDWIFNKVTLVLAFTFIVNNIWLCAVLYIFPGKKSQHWQEDKTNLTKQIESLTAFAQCAVYIGYLLQCKVLHCKNSSLWKVHITQLSYQTQESCSPWKPADYLHLRLFIYVLCRENIHKKSTRFKKSTLHKKSPLWPIVRLKLQCCANRGKFYQIPK
jgi:hypothetical protein